MMNSDQDIRRLISIGLLWFACLSCSSPQTAETTLPPVAPTSTEPVSIRYAQRFAIDYQARYPQLLLYGPADTTRYLLLPYGSSPPEDLSPISMVIRIPVQRIVTTSTTHLGLIEILDARARLVGISQADLVYDKDIRRRVEQGEIQEVGTNGSLNIELVLSLQPDLVMVSATPGVSLQQYEPLLDAGIPVVVNAEWMEASPLGKAEWVKLLAVLLQQEALANQRFQAIASTYDSIVQQTRGLPMKPQVITGSPFQGSWYVPGRNSYVGQLLLDAHASWPWEDDTTAISFNVAMETLYSNGLKADYWINPGSAQSISSLGEQDERLTAFRPFRRGEVYNHNRRLTTAGGNDYYESGTVRPDLILADLVEIFHPDVLNHTLYYYRPLE